MKAWRVWVTCPENCTNCPANLSIIMSWGCPFTIEGEELKSKPEKPFLSFKSKEKAKT